MLSTSAASEITCGRDDARGTEATAGDRAEPTMMTATQFAVVPFDRRALALLRPARYLQVDNGDTARTRLDVGGVALAYGIEGLARI
jgi:hypothetical protein